MTITEAIRNNEQALAAATRVVDGLSSPDWVTCRDVLRAITVTATPRKCGSKESSLAVAAAGANPFEMMEKLRADATGNLLYLRIADGSSEGGVVWAEPDLTVPYMQSRVEDFTQPVIDALVSLSAPVMRPHAEITADQCRDAFLSAGVSDWFAAQSAVIRERLAESTITTRQGLVDLLMGAV
jgi:hypothetical protein